MNRKQLYNEIVSLGLQGEVKAAYGKNYTVCTNEELQKIIKAAHRVLEDTVKISFATTCGPVYKLVDILAKKKILLKSEVDLILNA